MKVTLILISVLVTLANSGYAQVYDTIYHTKSESKQFKFTLADTNVTAFKISKINLTIIETDTIQKSIKTDTFFVKLNNNEVDVIYDYWLSRENWRRTILGSKCMDFKERINEVPKFKIRWNQNSESFSFINCQTNIQAISDAISVYIDCIKERDDQYMMKYAIEDLEKIKDCDKQTLMLMQDLGHLTSYMNFPIPDQDSLIRFSIVNRSDTTGLLTVNFYCEKFENRESLTINIGEDLTLSDGSSEKMHQSMYNALKDALTTEEQKRDSIRLMSRDDFELTSISIDKNRFFQKYKRYSSNSMFNIDLKMKKSEYWHVIERIED